MLSMRGQTILKHWLTSANKVPKKSTIRKKSVEDRNTGGE